MDRQIKKKAWTVKRILTFGGGGVLAFFIVYQFVFADRRSRLRVESDKITISTVQRGVFQEFIPQTGSVEPARTVYLDAIEGGNIKRVALESGALVKKGDVILELSNLNRELGMLTQEGNLNENINQLRTTRLNITQNDLNQRQTLAQIDNQLAILKPQYDRQKQLVEKRLIAPVEFERTQADYEYNLERRRITYEVYRNDSVNRVSQLRNLDASERRLTESLEMVGNIMENLILRSPIDGQLSTPHWEIGQAVNGGQRLGQVDELGSYKVRVPIDELYLPRITEGLHATTPYSGSDYELKITYIYPTIQNGRFEVDMEFVGDVPSGLRRGASLRLRIELGQSSEELLLPIGGFYQSSGGNWAFVLDNSGQAVRRDIRLGRRNTENYEVLEGLEPGDQVITSSYENFGNNEVLILN